MKTNGTHNGIDAETIQRIIHGETRQFIVCAGNPSEKSEADELKSWLAGIGGITSNMLTRLDGTVELTVRFGPDLTPSTRTLIAERLGSSKLSMKN